jgi:hypothetical protein
MNGGGNGDWRACWRDGHHGGRRRIAQRKPHPVRYRNIWTARLAARAADSLLALATIAIAAWFAAATPAAAGAEICRIRSDASFERDIRKAIAGKRGFDVGYNCKHLYVEQLLISYHRGAKVYTMIGHLKLDIDNFFDQNFWFEVQISQSGKARKVASFRHDHGKLPARGGTEARRVVDAFGQFFSADVRRVYNDCQKKVGPVRDHRKEAEGAHIGKSCVPSGVPIRP